MQKKALTTAISLAISSPLFANDVSFYAGGALLNTTLEVKYKQIPTAMLPNDDGVFESDDSATALKIFGGARWRLSKGFYGLEAAYEDGQSEATVILFPMSMPIFPQADFKDNDSFSLSFMGGYEFYQNTFLTVRVGYIRTNFDYKVYDTSSTTVVDSGDDTLSGIQIAVGVEYYFTDTFGMRVEYSEADYSDSIGPVNADGGFTGALAEFDDIARDAISIGIFTNF